MNWEGEEKEVEDEEAYENRSRNYSYEYLCWLYISRGNFPKSAEISDCLIPSSFNKLPAGDTEYPSLKKRIPLPSLNMPQRHITLMEDLAFPTQVGSSEQWEIFMALWGIINTLMLLLSICMVPYLFANTLAKGQANCNPTSSQLIITD